jgi:Transposase DDE domain
MTGRAGDCLSPNAAADKPLRTTGNVGANHMVLCVKAGLRRMSAQDSMLARLPSRKVTRDVNEDARDYARSFIGTPAFDKSRDEREKVEMRFTHLRTHHDFERMRLRGLPGARDEFHLAAIVQNLKTLAKSIWWPRPHEPAARIT